VHGDAPFHGRIAGCKLGSVKATTKQKWAERVQAWRASGQEASAFAADKGFEASTLRWWASRLGREEPVRIVPLIARVSSPESRGEVVVEVGGARVRVTSGFDGALLAQVVRALGGEP
jgi:hypothetical protein